MRGVPTIAGRLLAGGGRRAVLDLGLSAAGVAVAVAIVLLVLGGISGIEERADRTAWRHPTPAAAGADAVAVQQRVAERFSDTTVEVVRVRPADGVDPAAIDLPDGLPALPADGEVLVSPAARELLDLPDGDLLMARLGRSVVGEVGPASLAHRDDAVAVVGDAALIPTPADELPEYDTRSLPDLVASPAVAVEALAGEPGGQDLAVYRQMFGFAGVLLIAPSVVLLGAAARFTAARRARRLAGLRLAGASPGQITGIAALESVAGAVAGVVAGVALAQIGRVALAGVPVDGGPFGVAELGVPLWWMALVALAAIAVAVVATLTGLRRVRASPLGVVQPTAPRRPSALRVVLLCVALLAFGGAAAAVSAGGLAVLLMGGLALVIGGLGLAGPWFAWLLGWLAARRAGGPTALLAGRSITADPVGAFRPVTPIVLTAFVGGFLLVISGTTALLGVPAGGAGVLEVDGAARAAVEAALQGAGVEADVVEVGESGLGPVVEATLADPAEVEVARTALDDLVDPHVPATGADAAAEDVQLLGDITRGTVLLLALALVQSAAATGVSAAAGVLEHGRTLAALRLAGMEPHRMLRVRIAAAVLPVGAVAALSTGLGAGAAWAILWASGPSGLDIGLGNLLGPPAVVVAAAAAAAGGAVTAWPLLREVTARPLVDA